MAGHLPLLDSAGKINTSLEEITETELIQVVSKIKNDFIKIKGRAITLAKDFTKIRERGCDEVVKLSKLYSEEGLSVLAYGVTPKSVKDSLVGSFEVHYDTSVPHSEKIIQIYYVA